MTRLPLVNFARMEKLLLHLGFRRARQKGSHIFYRHPDGRCTTVPAHSTQDLARPLIREILREIDLPVERYVEMLNDL